MIKEDRLIIERCNGNGSTKKLSKLVVRGNKLEAKVSDDLAKGRG